MRIPLSAIVVMTLISSTSAAGALEIIGRISSVDLEGGRITLDNGQIFDSPGNNVLISVGAGNCVTVSYENADARNLISGITVLSTAPGSIDTKPSGDPCTELGSLQQFSPLPRTEPSRRRFKFRERPLSGEPTGKVIKSLPDRQ